MRKMWVRLSLAFSLVMFIAAFLPVFGLVLFSQPTFVASQGVLPSGITFPLPARVPQNVPPVGVVEIAGGVFSLEGFLFFLASINLLIGMIAGLWVSRSISKPATRLVTAVQAISRQNLSYRVPEDGSQELVDLARAINQMAGDLETAENARRHQLADVTHELRTPLTVLQGNLKAMLDGVYTINEDEIKSLYAQAEHLGQLVNDLHLLAQAEAGQLPNTPQVVNLSGLVKQVTKLFEALAVEKEIQITFESDGEDFTFEIDPRHIQQILTNLLSNAIKHTPHGETISVKLKRASDGVLLTVGDTGQGIPANELPFIFDRFYRRDESRCGDAGGSGLGLTVTKKIIEGLGGAIDVASERGKGSAFTVHLPVCPVKTGKQERHPARVC